MSEVTNTAPVNDTAPTEAAESTPEQTQQVATNETAQTAAEKRKYKYKVDGQEVEEELTDDDIKKHLSMSKAAYKRMGEAAKEKQQAQQLVKMLRENPEAVLNNEQIMGSRKFREIAETYLAKQLEDQMLSPEEKYKREMEQKLRQYEENERTQKEQVEAKQLEQLQNHYAQEYEKTILTGLQSQGLPKTARTVKRMAELMSKNLQHGFDLEPSQLAEIVRQDYLKEIQELFGSTDSDALLSLLGDGVSNKIRQADLKKLKANNPFKQSADNNQPYTKAEPKTVTKISKDEWRELLDKKLNS